MAVAETVNVYPGGNIAPAVGQAIVTFGALGFDTGRTVRDQSSVATLPARSRATNRTGTVVATGTDFAVYVIW